jgi:hypothetical protein
MNCPRDKEGFAIITVKDLKEYLSKFPDDYEVCLDKDGWMENETGIQDPTAVQIIGRRGLFHTFTHEGKTHLTINN